MPVLNRVREERMARHLTQQELANRAGCSRMSIAYIESHRMEPGGELMLKLARALEQPVEVLFEVVSETRIQQIVRAGKRVATEIPRQIVVAFVCMVLFFQGGAIAADHVSPAAGAFMRQMAQLVTHPERSVTEAAALDLSPLHMVTGMAQPSTSAPMSTAACAAWLARYGTLAETASASDVFSEYVLQRAASCFDIVGLSGDAVAAHEQLVDLATFNSRWALADAYAVHAEKGVQLYWAAEQASYLRDTAAASTLIREAVNDDGLIRYVLAVRTIAPQHHAGRDLAALLAPNEMAAERHLAVGIRDLTRAMDNRHDRRDLVAAQREGAQAKRAWPAIVASTRAWPVGTVYVRGRRLKADALFVLGEGGLSR